MEQVEARGLTNQLAEDLAWLEEHARIAAATYRSSGGVALRGGAGSQCCHAVLGRPGAQPLHVAVVGGAGAGKSTVANMLCGAVLAESNPQAGFTRHPVAYVHSNGAIAWPSSLGFLGTLQRLNKAEPSSLDADVYQVRRVSQEAGEFGVLEKFLVWDCPDMTTWQATGYVPRLLEVAGPSRCRCLCRFR